jgi:hypothetical protein
VAGSVAITGPGVSARLRGAEDGPAVLVVEGRLRTGRRATRSLAGRLASSGVEIHVRDGRGRPLATLGPGVRSPLGRALLGTGRVRPTPRGLLAAMRGAADRDPSTIQEA